MSQLSTALHPVIPLGRPLYFVAHRTKHEGHQPLDPAKRIVRRPWPLSLNQVIAVITMIPIGLHLSRNTLLLLAAKGPTTAGRRHLPNLIALISAEEGHVDHVVLVNQG